MVDKNGLELGTGAAGHPGKRVLVKNTTAADTATLRDTFGYKTDPIDGSTLIFTDLDTAFGVARAGLGDEILVASGYSESLASAGALTCDTAGVTIRGQGNGASRPQITFATLAAASISVTAASMRFENMVFLCNIASQNHMFDVAGDDLTIEDCDFREGSATGLSFITADTADADSDRLTIRRCKFHAPTAGNMDNAIQLAKDFTGVRIEDCEIHGDFDVAAIDVPAGGNAQVDLQIKHCDITNLQAAKYAIQIDSNTSSGKIVDCNVVTDAKATAVDAGGLEMFNVYYNDGTDQGGWSAIVAEPDSTTNILGADDADNGFDSSNVVANENGSVLERLEQIQEAVNVGTGTGLPANTSLADFVGKGTATQLAANESLVDVLYGANGIATFPAAAAPANGVSMAEVLRSVYDRQFGDGTNSNTNSLLGKKVTRAAADIINGATTAVFTVTGTILLTGLTGLVSVAAVDAGASNLKFQSNPTTGTTTDLCANLDVDSDEIGTMYSVDGAPGTALLRGESGNVQVMPNGPVQVAAGGIETVSSVDRGTGGALLALTAWYLPLSDGASLASA